MKHTVLLVEDEAAIADVVGMYLEQADFRVRWAPSANDAEKQLEDPTIDLVLLDLTLPGSDGVDLFREIRRRRSVPVVMVTGDAEGDRVFGLELGADDHVTKPLSPRELVARVRAVLRRGDDAGTEAVEGPISVGDIRIDPKSREVTAAGSPVGLTRMEFALLSYLLARPGRVLSRTHLLEAVWGYPGDVDSRTVDVHVAQLRRKLGELCPVRTVRGVGYKAEHG